MDFKQSLENFKQIAIKNFQMEGFVFRDFLVKDHIEIVERIAMELCDLYPEADREAVSTLVWLHDFGKPLDMKNEYERTLADGAAAMKSSGFSDEFIDQVVSAWKRMEMKNEIDLAQEPIEVQIISSADGAAHFVGKFHSTYFRDDLDEPFEEIVQRLRKKIEADWSRKIVLPEVKKAFEWRYKRALEIVGDYPEKFIY